MSGTNIICSFLTESTMCNPQHRQSTRVDNVARKKKSGVKIVFTRSSLCEISSKSFIEKSSKSFEYAIVSICSNTFRMPSSRRRKFADDSILNRVKASFSFSFLVYATFTQADSIYRGCRKTSIPCGPSRGCATVCRRTQPSAPLSAPPTG